MQNSLERRASNGKRVGDILLAPLIAEGIEPKIVDVGARSGMFLVPPVVAEKSVLVGFEPNPEEYRKLVERNTDAMKAGLSMPRFRRLEYFDSAVWNADEQANIYITIGPGAVTMMGETTHVAHHMLRDYGAGDPRTGMSFHDQVGIVREVSSVKARKLDTLLSHDETIDFLKVDVEGAELRVFQGAEKLFDLKKILFIQTEFVALPYYQEHPLFGDQHVYLRDKGMRLLDIELGHAYYHRTKHPLPRNVDRPLLHAGDAYFALDPDAHDLSPVDRQRMAIFAFVFGFNSFGMSLVREAKLCTAADIEAIHEALSRISAYRRLKTAWMKFPETVQSVLLKLGHKQF